MILVDTSVWVDHFRRANARLAGVLEQGQVVIHPFVTGELACGKLGNRSQVLRLLQQLPQAPQASQDELLSFIEARSLMGSGIGFVDAHLLASTALGDGLSLWTLDKRLQSVAASLVAH